MVYLSKFLHYLFDDDIISPGFNIFILCVSVDMSNVCSFQLFPFLVLV